MPRFVKFTGDVPLLEDIQDLFMTWLSDSDVQDALPPVEKGGYNSFASGNINNIFLPAIWYIARSWLGNAASTLNGHYICQFVYDYLHACRTSRVQSIESVEVVLETAEWCGFKKTVI